MIFTPLVDIETHSDSQFRSTPTYVWYGQFREDALQTQFISKLREGVSVTEYANRIVHAHYHDLYKEDIGDAVDIGIPETCRTMVDYQFGNAGRTLVIRLSVDCCEYFMNTSYITDFIGRNSLESFGRKFIRFSTDRVTHDYTFQFDHPMFSASRGRRGDSSEISFEIDKCLDNFVREYKLMVKRELYRVLCLTPPGFLDEQEAPSSTPVPPSSLPILSLQLSLF